MKRLIICNTYYQMILAIQMRKTLFKNDEVDIWISDNSANAIDVAKRLDDTKVFSGVFYVENKVFTYKQSRIQNVKDIVTYNFGPIKTKVDKLYDEIIFYNLELDLYAIADYYQAMGHVVQWSRFEEGILSYNTDFSSGLRIRATRNIRKITNRIDVAECVTRYYCSFPELKETYREWEFVNIPPISKMDDEFRAVLNEIFAYKPIHFKQKYIFFASSSDIDGRPFGETELVLKIADRVGKENLLVKMHPRDTRTVYEDYGIAVLRDSYIPWELMQLNGLMDDTVLLTIHSGAFLSVTAVLNQETKGYFLYKTVFCETEAFNARSKEITSTLNKLHNMNRCQNIYAEEYVM